MKLTPDEECKDTPGATPTPKGCLRNDRYNQEIKWGQKKHKITFMDQVEQKPLTQVFQVESYKAYNRTALEQGGGCILF